MPASYVQGRLEESPRAQNAPATAPSRVSTDAFYFPITAFGARPNPQHLNRDDEERGIEGGVPILIDGYEPAGTLRERLYFNNLLFLLAIAGIDLIRTPGDGIDEVQTVTISGGPTGGTFTLSFGGQVTAAIAYNATAAQVQAALEALSTIGAGNVLVTGGPGPATPYSVRFIDKLGSKDVAALVAAHVFTGGTTPNIAVTTATPGSGTVLDPDGNGIPVGASKWVGLQRTGVKPKTAQMTAHYENEAKTIRMQGIGASSLSFGAGGEVEAALMGMVFGRLAATPADVPSWDTAQIPPGRRGDLAVVSLAGGATLDDFSLAVGLALERVRGLNTASYFPTDMERGNERMILTGSLPKRRYADADLDALLNASTFLLKAIWNLPAFIGATKRRYGMWLEAPSAQLTGGGADDRSGASVRVPASYDFRASWDETAGYAFRFTLVNAVTSIETYSA